MENTWSMQMTHHTIYICILLHPYTFTRSDSQIFWLSDLIYIPDHNLNAMILLSKISLKIHFFNYAQAAITELYIYFRDLYFCCNLLDHAPIMNVGTIDTRIPFRPNYFDESSVWEDKSSLLRASLSLYWQSKLLRFLCTTMGAFIRLCDGFSAKTNREKTRVWWWLHINVCSTENLLH